MRMEDKPPDFGTLKVLLCQNIVHFMWAVMFGKTSGALPQKSPTVTIYANNASLNRGNDKTENAQR